MQEFLKDYPDIQVVGEKLDDGFSGLQFEQRPAFQEMMQEVMEGKCNCIIVRDLSRLGREYIDTGTYLREIFPKWGIRFISIGDNIDSLKNAKVGEQLEVTLKTMLNDSYSLDISKKTKSALKAKRENGEFIGANVTYGYRRSDIDKNTLVIDENAAKVVVDIFSMKKEGHSALRIASILNEKKVLSPQEYKKSLGIPIPTGGYTTKEDTLWSATTINRLLKNELYTGTLIQGKQTTLSYKLKNIKHKPREEWAIVEHTHEAIISKVDFNLVQKLMNLDTRTSPKAEGVYLFSGILVCGCCGSRMTRKTVPYKDRKYFYYYCPTGKKNGCNAKMVKELELLECITASVKHHILSVIDLEKVVAQVAVVQWNQETSAKIVEQLGVIQEEIDTIKLFQSKMYENLVQGHISKIEYADMKQDYNQRVEVKKAQKKALEEELETVTQNSSQQMKWHSLFKEFEDMETLSRSCLIQLVELVTLDSDHKMNIKYRFQSEYDTITSTLEKISNKEEAMKHG